jgi:hypothetical protein
VECQLALKRSDDTSHIEHRHSDETPVLQRHEQFQTAPPCVAEMNCSRSATHHGICPIASLKWRNRKSTLCDRHTGESEAFRIRLPAASCLDRLGHDRRNRGLQLTLLKPCDEPPTVSVCSYHSYTMSGFWSSREFMCREPVLFARHLRLTDQSL